MNFLKFTHIFSFTLLLALLLPAFTVQAQDYTYDDAWNKSGYSIETQTRSNVQINYSIDKFSIADTRINNTAMQTIVLSGTMIPNDEGMPDLPGTSRYIAIPEGATARLNILEYRMETIQGVEVAPAPRIPLDTDKSPLHFEKGAKYSENAFYPAEPIQISKPTEIRGVDAVMLGITPFQYNPVTKELRVYRDVKVEISFDGGSGEFGDSRLRNRWWDPIMQDVFLNSASLPTIDYNKQHQQAMANREAGCEYLIVVPNNPEFMQWADSIKDFRQKQGILTNIVTLQEIGGSTTTILENYFNDAYANWDMPPAAVLLLADYGTSPANSIVSPIWDNYCASDNIYADVNNNDMPDIIFARITANNAAQLEVMVTKFIHYEKNPPTNPDFYNHPITALGWQTERWFQLCSEVVGGFWRKQGKDPVRVNAIYQGTPGSIWSSTTYGNTQAVVDYFGPNGEEYIPLTPAELGGWSGGTPAMVNNAINSGAFMLQHRDHGYEQGWGEPDYSSSNINALTNTDLTFVMSINCLTGKYNMSSECFTEKFHRYTKNGQNSGALGLIAASEVSYSFVNDVYVWGMFDNMYPEFMPTYGMPVQERGLQPAFANAAGKYFLQQSAWPYNTNNKEVTYNLFHHHGGAFLTVYSEVPQDLAVTHNPILISGETSFSVTADAGAFIALTVDGEIIGTGEATGAPVSIEIEAQLPPNSMMITITKQNYYRYETQVDIIPPSGPYVVFNQFEIDDAAGGNGNSMMDFGEDIMLDITLENVGVETSENSMATLTCEDEYITLINAVADFGSIDANATAQLIDAFEIEVADNVPDNRNVAFTLTVTNGTDTWESFFSIMAHAPVLEVTGMSVNDVNGNGNGFLDPGENADITFETANNGSSNAMDVMAEFVSMSPFLTINNATFDLEDLDAGQSASATFSVSVDMTTPIGTVVDLIYTVTSGMYSVEELTGLKVGLIIEDFESGDFGEYEWGFGGTADWQLTTSGAYEGTYAAKSGTIGDEQESELMLTMEVINDDEISFYRKVSSESGYDYLRFYIDGTQQGEWAGEMGWAQETYSVSAGEHTFKWSYEKDYSVANGSDCGWVDYITFPAAANDAMTVYAGADAETCEGEAYQLSAVALNYESILWTTSGTGNFDDNTALDATYNPSTDDYASGSVVLTITIYGQDSEMSDDLELTFMPMPGQCPAPSGETELCINPGMMVYETEEMAGMDDYGWAIEPAEAGTINYTMHVAEITWSESYTGMAQVMVMGMNACGNGEMSSPLEVNIVDVPATAQMPTGETELCEGTATSTFVVAEIINTAEYMWALMPEDAGIIAGTDMQATVTWTSEWSGDAQIMVKGINDCGESDFSPALDVTMTAMPASPAKPTGETELCENSTSTTYQTTGGFGADEYIWEIMPEDAGTIATTGMEATVSWNMGWNGNAQIMVKGINDCGESDYSSALEIVVTALPEMPEMPTGETELCENNTNTTYQTTETTGADEYLWEIMPAEAGLISFEGNTAEVAWIEGFNGQASVSVKGINTCGESDFSESLMINLAALPAKAETVGGTSAACQGTINTFTVSEIATATNYEWIIEPEEAGNVAVTNMGMSVDITLSNTWEGDASIKVRGQNNCGLGEWSDMHLLTIQDCTGIGENEDAHFSVYPNPNKGIFTIQMEANENVDIQLLNAMGALVYSEIGLRVNGIVEKQIHTTNIPNGIYYLHLIGENFNTIEKIIIRK